MRLIPNILKYRLYILLPGLVILLAAKNFNSNSSAHASSISAMENQSGIAGKKLSNIDSLLQSADIVVIDFWFTGCPPCVKATPELEALFEKYGSSRVKFYGLTAFDDDTQLENFKSKVKVTYPLLQITSEVNLKYSVMDYPTLKIFMKGKPALTIEGHTELFKSQVEEQIKALLK